MPDLRKLSAHLMRLARFLSKIVLLLAATSILAPAALQLISRLDMFANFRFYWIPVLLALSAFFFLTRQAKLAALAIALTLCAFASILRFEFGAEPTPSWANGEPIRVAAYNIRASKTRTGEKQTRFFSEEFRPDILLLTEINDYWIEQLAELQNRFPHQVAEPRRDSNGLWLLSRYPIVSIDSAGIDPNLKYPYFSARIRMPRGPIHLFGIHPPIPISQSGFRRRNAQFRAVADFAAKSEIPVIVAGDFNCTPFSSHFAKLLERGSLKNTATGFGLRNTYRRDLTILPIDHILVSKDVHVANHAIGPGMGSDHCPVLVEIQVKFGD